MHGDYGTVLLSAAAVLGALIGAMIGGIAGAVLRGSGHLVAGAIVGAGIGGIVGAPFGAGVLVLSLKVLR